jgi:hypothetical protein
MTEAILALTYDPSVLSVSSADITLGSIPGLAGWHLESEVDARTGTIGITLYNTTALTAADAGSLVNIAFHVAPGASVPATAVQLVNSALPNGRQFTTQVDDAQGQFILSPGVDRFIVPTGAAVLTPVPTYTASAVAAADEHVVHASPSGGDDLPAALIVSAPADMPPPPLPAEGASLNWSAAPRPDSQILRYAPDGWIMGSAKQAMTRVLDALDSSRWLPAKDPRGLARDGAILDPDWLAVPSAADVSVYTADAAAETAAQPAAEPATPVSTITRLFAQLADDIDDFGDY